MFSRGVRSKLGRVLLVVVIPCVVLGTSTVGASAHHRKGTYGSHGYTWFARYYDNAHAFIASNYCNARETSAYSRVRSSTQGKAEFAGRWPSGISLRQDRCDGRIDYTNDITLIYDPNFASTHGNFGGDNHSYVAPRSWCAIWDAPYPCGYHPSVVHLNKSRFTSSSYSTAYRERLIMHETGHSLGLAHHCSSDSIMNDGTSGCNGGRWTAVMSYLVTDRQGIRATFPGWRYP